MFWPIRNLKVTVPKIAKYVCFVLFQSLKVCDIEDDVKDALRNFRFRKHENNTALVCKYLAYSYYIITIIVYKIIMN